MTKTELQHIAEAVEKAFTPYAFSCVCLGEEKSCLAVLQDEIQVAKMYQIQRVARFIKELQVK
jgi:hypothetical protein